MADKEKELSEELLSDLPPPAFDSSLRPRPQHKVGFDCEFIERPKELQTDCPICLHVLRDPYQATCCGYIYCRSCIDRVRSESKQCPTCNSNEFNIFPDKRLHKTLYDFKVWCSNKKQGCNWSGELRELSSHMNTEPVHDRRLLGCDFVTIECHLCHEFVARGKLKPHESKLCLFREYTCEHCEKYTSSYTDVIKNHLPQCPFQLVPCPNKCEAKVERRRLERHLKEECEMRPPEKVPCEFSFAGCSEMITPDKIQEHLDESVHQHLSLLATSHLALRERLIELQRHFDENNKYIDKLQEQKREMQEHYQSEIQEMRALRLEFDKIKTKQTQDHQVWTDFFFLLPLFNAERPLIVGTNFS